MSSPSNDGKEKRRGNRGGYSSRRGQRRGGNRSFEDSNNENQEDVPIDTSSPIAQQFLQYQQELDTRHDKYERLVKRSRDVTIESKRIIFLLHRIKKSEEKAILLQEACTRLKELETSLLRGLVEELVDEDVHKYLRAYSAGIQEFVEALTFYHYEMSEKLISLEEIKIELEENIGDQGTDGIVVDDRFLKALRMLILPSDYILGIADLTGELMRKCIMAIGAGHVEMPFELCKFLRQIHDGFVSIGNLGPREVTRKLYTLRQSLAKVETACYTLQVRGSEIPKHMLVDVFTMDSHSYRDDFEQED